MPIFLGSSIVVNLVRRESMKMFYFGACLFILSIYTETSYCERGISHAVKSRRSINGQLTNESYNMFINEQGSHFTEKVSFDNVKKTVIYHVPAHRDISESDFLMDFHLNVTVIRLLGHGVCYIRPRSATEPPMDLLWKSMNMVSTGKYRIRKGSKLLSSEWMPTGPVDSSELTENINEFCRGLTVHKIGMVEQDSVTVIKGISRNKRYIPFCKHPLTGYPELANCPRANHVTKCKFPSHSCVYWVTCTGGIYGVRNQDGGCDSNHEIVNAYCCDVSCP